MFFTCCTIYITQHLRNIIKYINVRHFHKLFYLPFFSSFFPELSRAAKSAAIHQHCHEEFCRLKTEIKSSLQMSTKTPGARSPFLKYAFKIFLCIFYYFWLSHIYFVMQSAKFRNLHLTGECTLKKKYVNFVFVFEKIRFLTQIIFYYIYITLDRNF